MGRGVTEDNVFGWKATDDFNDLASAGQTGPTGIWSDGETMWVADDANDKIYAYSLYAGKREPGNDFNTLADAGNEDPNGLWSDGETMWVADPSDDKIYAYNMNTKLRDSDRDFGLSSGNRMARGLWSDGETMWVSDNSALKIYAYNMATKARDGRKDINLVQNNTETYGLWSDGRTMWVANRPSLSIPLKLFSYDLETGQPTDPSLDYPTAVMTAAGNTSPHGIWSDGSTMWVADSGKNKIYSYHSPTQYVRVTRTEGNDETAREGATLSFDVTRTGLSGGWLTVAPTRSWTGDPFPAGFSWPNPNLLFAPDERTKTITVRTENDRDYELDGSVTLGVREWRDDNPENVYRIHPTQSSATYRVTDDEPFPPIEVRTDQCYTVFENEGPSFRMPVYARVVPSGAPRFNYTTGLSQSPSLPRMESFGVTASSRAGTAKPGRGKDYEAVSWKTLFAPGAWRYEDGRWTAVAEVPVLIFADGPIEDDKEFTMLLERAPGLDNAIFFANSEAKIAIVDTGPKAEGIMAEWHDDGVLVKWEPPAPLPDARWLYTLYRKEFSSAVRSHYEAVAWTGDHQVEDASPGVHSPDGSGIPLFINEYVVEGIAYHGDNQGVIVARWWSNPLIFRGSNVVGGCRGDIPGEDVRGISPSWPQNLRASIDTGGNAALDWERPQYGPVTAYQVFRREIPDTTPPADVGSIGFGHTGSVSGGDTTTYTDATAVAGKLYEYYVASENGRAEGGKSMPVRIRLPDPGAPPSAPRNLRAEVLRNCPAEGQSSHTVELRWDAPTTGAPETYRIMRRPLYPGGTALAELAAVSNSTAFTDPEVPGLYEYRVIAENANGRSRYSNFVRLDQYSGGGDPAPNRTWLTATSRSAHSPSEGNSYSILLEWRVPGCAGTYASYQVWRRLVPLDGSQAQFKVLAVDTGSNTRSYLDSQVQPGREYEYRIFAANGTRRWLSPIAGAETPFD